MNVVLFDLDGTLTDPGEGIVRCITAALRQVGLPIPSASRLRSCVGPPLRESFVGLGAQPDQVAPLVEIYRERFRRVGMFENEVYPEIPSVLAKLRSDGARLMVATSKPTPFAIEILEHFGLAQFFDRVFGSNLDGSLSNKAELLGHIRREAALAPRTSALVGDRRFDISAARAHGIYAIGVLWGYGTRGELERAGAHCVIDAPHSVLGALAAHRELAPDGASGCR